MCWNLHASEDKFSPLYERMDVITDANVNHARHYKRLAADYQGKVEDRGRSVEVRREGSWEQTPSVSATGSRQGEFFSLSGCE